MHPIPVSDRLTVLYLDHASIGADGHSVVMTTEGGVIPLPVAKTAVLMLGPGSSITHAAVKLCSDEGALLLWVGEHGVRIYSAGMPGGSNSDNLVRQCSNFVVFEKRILVARRLFREMFKEEPPKHCSLEALRGIEGGKVKAIYSDLAVRHGLPWSGRKATDFRNSDPLNRAISTSTAALYGLCESVILALGYSPAVGFVHSGDKRSFVYDLADTVKFRTVVPLAFSIVAESVSDIEGRTRRACRDLFFEKKLADEMIIILERVFSGVDCD